MRVRRGCGCYASGEGGGADDSMSAALCPSKDVEEEVDEKVRARALALAQQPKP